MSEHELLDKANTYVLDAENAAEMARLMTLARHIGEHMDGLFPPSIDPAALHQVLDVACGPGQWVLDVARRYPHIQVTGGDISNLMIAYAASLTTDLPNAHFQIMDAQQPFDFPDQTFDVVQARFISAFMHTSVWPELLRESHRILKPGGTICLTECENLGITNSTALEQLSVLISHAARQAGHCFTSYGNISGITPLMPRLLEDQNFQQITQRAYALNFSAGRKSNNALYTIYKTGLKLIQPFLVQSGVATQVDIDALYERGMQDMQAPDFCGQFFYLAVSGDKAN